MYISLVPRCTIITVIILIKLNLFTCVEDNKGLKFENLEIVDSKNDLNSLKSHNTPNYQNVDPSTTTPANFSSHSENENKTQLLTVNIENKDNNDLINYKRDYRNNGDLFTASKPNLIYQVKEGNQVIWKSKDSNHPYKVFVGDKIEGNRNIKAFFPSFSNSYQQSEQSDLSEPEYQLIELDVKFKEDDKYVTYKKDPKTGQETFTCKEGIFISKVVNNGELVVQSPKLQYFNRVVILKDEQGEKKLRCLFPEDDKEYRKDSSESESVKSKHEHEHIESETEHVPVVDYEIPKLPEFKLKYPLTKPEPVYHDKPKLDEHKEPELVEHEKPELVEHEKHKPDEHKEPELVKHKQHEPVEHKHKHEHEPEHKHESEFETIELESGFKFEPKQVKTKLVEPEPEKHKPVPLTQKLTSEMPKPSKPLFVTLDINYKEGSKYVRYEYNPSIKLHTFTPNPGFIIDRIIKGKHQVWNYEHGEYPEKVLILPDKFGKNELQIKFPTKPGYEPTQKHTQLSVEIEPLPHKTVVPFTYKCGENIYKKLPVELVLDFTQNPRVNYEVFIGNRTFVPVDRHLFNYITISDANKNKKFLLWKTSNPYEYCYKVEQFGFNHVMIYLNNGNYIFFNKNNKNQWTSKVDRNLVEKTFYQIQKIEVPEITPERLEKKILRRQPIPLDIGNKWSNYMIEYIKKETKGTFKPSSGHIFNTVVDTSPSSGDKVTKIWETFNSNEYSDMVELNFINNVITIYCMDGTIKQYKNVNNIWVDYSFDRTVDNTSKIPITINLDRESRNAIYEYNTDIYYKTITCTVKDNYAIKELLWIESNLFSFRPDRKIWSTDDPLYYARRVYVKDLKLGKKVVTIELFNGLHLIYHRHTWGLSWEFIGSNVPSKKEVKVAGDNFYV